MKQPRTAAERYLAERLQHPEYAAAYRDAADRIGRIDAVMRALDARREELAMSKAELARRAGVKPEAVRRLFSSERHNPTLATVVALADALELDVLPVARRSVARRPRRAAAATGTPSDIAQTRLQTV